MLSERPSLLQIQHSFPWGFKGIEGELTAHAQTNAHLNASKGGLGGGGTLAGAWGNATVEKKALLLNKLKNR